MRAWHKLTIALVIILGLLAAADRVAVRVADDKVAERIQSHEGLDTKPKVSIGGFPFLTQVVARKLDSVHISADDIEVRGGGRTATLQTFSAQVSGLRVNSSFSSATADSATGTGVISYADITSLIGKDGVTVTYGGNGRIKVSGKIDTVLGKVDGTGTARLAVQGTNTLTVSDISVDGLDTGVDIGSVPGLDTAFGSLITTSQRISGLPVGLRLQSVEPRADGVAVGFTGRNLQLAG
jgi:hypothetical protein